MGDTELKSPSLVQKLAHQNALKNPPGRRKRKRRKKRRESRRKRSARVVTTAVMTAVRPKTSRGGKGLRVDIKTRKLLKPEEETRTAAQGTVMMMMTKKGTDGYTVAKDESTTPTRTLTRVLSQKRRGGKTGEQQARITQMIVPETDLQVQAHSSGNHQ